MASLSDMSRSEKEECVIRLYKENKSTREIAKIMHMSFHNIGAITKKAKLEAARERGQLEEDDIKSKSKTTQAIKLFSELKSPVEVAIELDLSVNQVQAIYREYWELEAMYGLTQIYEEAKHDKKTHDGWKSELREFLQLEVNNNSVSWINDENLREFFKRELAEYKAEPLSVGAGHGAY